MKTMTTLDELARALVAVRGSVRMAYRRGAYVCAVEFPGGSATFTNADLPPALGAALCFLYQHNPRATAAPEAIEPAVADPDGAKVGPAPTQETRVGYIAPNTHCSNCGFGENPEEQYDSRYTCPNCGSTETCSKPNGHEDGVHAPITE